MRRLLPVLLFMVASAGSARAEERWSIHASSSAGVRIGESSAAGAVGHLGGRWRVGSRSWLEAEVGEGWFDARGSELTAPITFGVRLETPRDGWRVGLALGF